VIEKGGILIIIGVVVMEVSGIETGSAIGIETAIADIEAIVIECAIETARRKVLEDILTLAEIDLGLVLNLLRVMRMAKLDMA